jgi:succinyl-diaminopimelate desuccinylase
LYRTQVRYTSSDDPPVDQRAPRIAATTIGYATSWPAFRLAEDTPIVAALREAAARHLDRTPAPKGCRPSDIGNYLASLGIPTTAGFGAYRNLHGTDECIQVTTVPTMQAVCHEAVLALLT